MVRWEVMGCSLEVGGFWSESGNGRTAVWMDGWKGIGRTETCEDKESAVEGQWRTEGCGKVGCMRGEAR